jgi:nucleoside-diphosphate-sugar epimerase
VPVHLPNRRDLALSGPHALVTGGTGFLMVHVIREWLETVPEARVTAIGRTQPGPEVAEYLEPVGDRVTFLRGDVRHPEAWAADVQGPVDYLVHGAALCPMTEVEEKDLWAETVSVNVMGTVAILSWAAGLMPRPRRVLYVSSGVYGYGSEASHDTPPAQPVQEHTPLAPEDATYDITKATGEWLVARWAALNGIETVAVRPSAIFGPLDRDTEGRMQHPAPWHIARAALGPGALSVNDAQAGYDWLFAPDAGRAIAMILNATTLRHACYNIGYGRPATLADLAKGARVVCPGFELVETEDPVYVQRTDRRGGVWAVRATDRLEDEFGWRPTPLPEAMAAYLRWLQDGTHAADLQL